MIYNSLGRPVYFKAWLKPAKRSNIARGTDPLYLFPQVINTLIILLEDRIINLYLVSSLALHLDCPLSLYSLVIITSLLISNLPRYQFALNNYLLVSVDAVVRNH